MEEGKRRWWGLLEVRKEVGAVGHPVASAIGYTSYS
jgi:hypothetical protein